jgi:hypothetical protein
VSIPRNVGVTVTAPSPAAAICAVSGPSPAVDWWLAKSWLYGPPTYGDPSVRLKAVGVGRALVNETP